MENDVDFTICFSFCEYLRAKRDDMPIKKFSIFSLSSVSIVTSLIGMCIFVKIVKKGRKRLILKSEWCWWWVTSNGQLLGWFQASSSTRLVCAIASRTTSLLPLIAVVLQPYALSASFLASLLNRNHTELAGSLYILHREGTIKLYNPSPCSLR